MDDTDTRIRFYIPVRLASANIWSIELARLDDGWRVTYTKPGMFWDEYGHQSVTVDDDTVTDLRKLAAATGVDISLTPQNRARYFRELVEKLRARGVGLMLVKAAPGAGGCRTVEVVA